ncbi:MAG: LysE family transporter [Bilophila sp.]
MLPVETLGAFFAGVADHGVGPGPDILFVLTQSALYGARAGLVTTCGLIPGLLAHITAVSLGMAALFQSSAATFNLLKFAGAAYLLYLACGFPSRHCKSLAARGPFSRLCCALSARSDRERHQSQGDAFSSSPSCRSSPIPREGTLRFNRRARRAVVGHAAGFRIGFAVGRAYSRIFQRFRAAAASFG